MSKQTKVLSQEEMRESLNNFLIKNYLKNGSIKATPKKVKKKLNFKIKKEILDDIKMSMRCGLIEIEIEAQCEPEGQKDILKYYKKVSKKITSFDFTKYENMNINEFRTYLMVWDERISGNPIVIGKNLIIDKVDRACVGVYSLLKGGTAFYRN